MRLVVFLVCLALLCGCVKNEAEAPVAVVPPRVYFFEDFSGGLLNWSVNSSGGGAIKVVDRESFKIYKAAELRSQGLKSAYATAPQFPMDWEGDYVVSFDYMLQHRENFGYTVYKDRHVDLALEQASGIACVEGEKRVFLGRFDNNVWHRVVVKVSPSEGVYDVLLDGELKKSCMFHKSDVKSFIFGDTDPTDTVYGDGLWDNFNITDKAA